MSCHRLLHSFKAGKSMVVDKKLVADPRPGLLCLHVEDDMVHVTWGIRQGEGAMQVDQRAQDQEEDLVVFPGECILSQIGSTRTYVLKFKDDPSRNLYFWLQEAADVTRDQQNVSLFNTLMNNPEEEDASMQIDHPVASSPLPPPASASLASILESALRNVNPSPIGGNGGDGSISSFDANQLAASLISGFQSQGRNTVGRKRAAEELMRSLAQDQGPSLGDVLKPDLLVKLLDLAAATTTSVDGTPSNTSNDEKGKIEGGDDHPMIHPSPLLHRLGEFLPEEHRGSEDELKKTYGSSAFKQQLASLSHALQTGQLSFEQLGLEGSGFSTLEFLEAFVRSADKTKRAGRQ